MKKYIVFLVVLSIFVLGVSKVQAVSMSDLMAKINQLTNQVNSLQANVLSAVTRSTTTPTVSPVSTTILKKGMTSAEIMSLQSALKNQGYFVGNATGYFGDVTAKAVSSFQASKGLPVTGIIDANTKSLISPTTSLSSTTTTLKNPTNTDVVYPCTSNTPSITVLSPNGGETYAGISGTNVNWTSCGYPANSNIKIVLHDLSGTLSGFPATLFLVSALNDGQEFITFPSGYGSSFKVEVKSATNNLISDFSNNTFSILPAQNINNSDAHIAQTVLVNTSSIATSGLGDNDDVGTFSLKFDITAIDGDIYIPQVVSFSVENGILLNVNLQNGATEMGGLNGIITCVNACDTSSGNHYIISNGETERFNITAMVDNSLTNHEADDYRLSLMGIPWNYDDSPLFNVFIPTSGPYNTPYLYLN